MSLSEKELETLLEEYEKTKNERLNLEKKEEKCKNLIIKLMNESSTDVLRTNKLKVTRKTSKRLQLIHKNIPKDIFDEYADYVEYSTLYLSKV